MGLSLSDSKLHIKGQILDIDRFTSHDGPGIRSTVFLRGCPLKCVWCHSPESQAIRPMLYFQSMKCKACFQCVDICPFKAIVANTQKETIDIDRDKCKSCGTCVPSCPSKAMELGGYEATVEEVLSIVVKDKPYYKNSGGGVTLSGGELLMQHDFSFHLLKACQEQKIHTAIETSGFGTKKAIDSIASVSNLIFYDIKTMDSDEHKAFTGVSNEIILRNLETLCQDNTVRERIVIRVPCIPSLNDSAQQIANTAQYVAGLGIQRIELLRYNEAAGAKYQWIDEVYPLEGTKAQTDEAFEKLKRICEETGLKTISF